MAKTRYNKKPRKTRTKSRTYKGGSNATYSTTRSQNEYRTRMVQEALERARQLQASESGHSKNRPGPGTLKKEISDAYNEYNKAIEGTTRR
jgi:hypothetical protein